MQTYIKLAVGSMRSKPFFTFVTLFGISLTLAFLLVIGSFVNTSYGNYGLEKNMGHILISSKIKVTRKVGYSISRYSHKAYKDHFSKMKTPKEVMLMQDKGKQKIYYKATTERVERKGVSANYHKVLSFDLLKGRHLTKEDQEQKRMVTVITDKLANTLFRKEGKDPLGKVIRISSVDYTICGVVKEGNKLRNLSYADVYTPYTIDPLWSENKFLGNYTILMFFDSKEELENGRIEFESIVSAFPLNKGNNEVKMEGVCLLNTEIPFYNLFEIRSTATFYGVIFTIVLVFMALPAFNLVNINITKAMGRSGEIGVRKAFGASTSGVFTELCQFLFPVRSVWSRPNRANWKNRF